MKISREVLVQMLTENPDVTLKEMAVAFGCGVTTIQRRLGAFGLRTKGWLGRKHSLSTRQAISKTRIERGVAKGEHNPNHGIKKRPWLEGKNHPLRMWHRQHPDFGKDQRGKNNPIHKVQHLYDDPEYVKKITRGLKVHVDLKRGSTYEEVYGPEKAAEYREKLRAASPVRLAKFRRKETEPERIIRGILEQLGVPYRTQVPMGYHTVDFLIDALKVVIQADGDYWHSNPLKYGDAGGKPLGKGQRRTKRIDASCNTYLTNRGYKVLRFWESDLKEHQDVCVQRLKEVLHG